MNKELRNFLAASTEVRRKPYVKAIMPDRKKCKCCLALNNSTLFVIWERK